MFDNYMEGTRQPNPVDVAIQQMTLLGNEIRDLNQAVMANNHFMVGMMQEEIAKAERGRRKQRKKEIQAQVAVSNGHFGLVKFFDDGTKEFVDLALNLVPDFQIYKFDLLGFNDSRKYFGIYSKIPEFWVLGEIEKLSGKYLWEAFVKSGVRFNSQLTKNKIEQALYEFFMPKIHIADLKPLPALAGWFHGKFLSSETFFFMEDEGFSELPIRKKSFSNYSEFPLCTEKYFEKIREIQGWKNRLWMMLFPIGGLLSSLLEEFGIRPTRFLNMVILEDMPVSRMGEYLQIFNRNSPFEETICVADVLQRKDEVLILNGYSSFGNSEYKYEQRIKKYQNIAEGIVNREFITVDGFPVSSPVAIFSDRIVRKRHAINIFVDKDFFEVGSGENLLRRTEVDALGVTFHYFVNYIEKNFDDIKNFLSMGKEANTETAWLCFSFKIFQKFWESFGIDIIELAGLPETFDFHDLLQDELLFEDEIMADFVKIVRRETQDWRIIPKDCGIGNGSEIVYSEKFIWIPVLVMEQMFLKYGIKSQRFQFLEKLKTEGQLITDERGLSRKVQVAGKRYESYQFQRGLFHIPGTVDITELGKEG